MFKFKIKEISTNIFKLSDWCLFILSVENTLQMIKVDISKTLALI